MFFGRKLDTQVTQFILGARVEPERVRPFLYAGEKLAEGGEVVDRRPVGFMGGRVYAPDEAVGLRSDPNMPS